MSLQRNQRRGKRAITPFRCLQFLLFAAVSHSARQQRFGQPWKTLLAASGYPHFERSTWRWSLPGRL